MHVLFDARILLSSDQNILKGSNFGRLYYMSTCILALISDNCDFFHNLFKFVIWFFPKSKHITMIEVFLKSINPWKGPRFGIEVLIFLRFYIFEKGVKTNCDQWQWIGFMWFSKFCGGSLFLKITKNLKNSSRIIFCNFRKMKNVDKFSPGFQNLEQSKQKRPWKVHNLYNIAKFSI